MNKKIWYLLWLLAAVFMVSAPGFAQAEEIDLGELSQVNPLYADIITEEEINELYQEQALVSIPDLLDDAPSYSWSSYVTALRGKLKNFTTNFTLTIYTNTNYTTNTLFYDGIESAIAHTGVPNEGDYLRWNMLKWGMTTSLYSGGSYKYRYELTFQVTYWHSTSQEKEVTSKIGSAASSLRPVNSTDGAKIRAVYNYVMNRIVYTDNGNYSHSTHAALISGRAVCQGYATLMYRLLLMLGIDNRVVNSNTHGWNLARAGNLYYHIDATWGDGPGYADKFFLKNYSTIKALDGGGNAHVLTSDCQSRISRYNISSKNYTGSEEKPVVTPVPTAKPDASTAMIRYYNPKTYTWVDVTGKTITLDPASGETAKLDIRDRKGALSASWKISSSSIAKLTSYSSYMVVSGLKNGTATVTATVKGLSKGLKVTLKFVPQVQSGSLKISGSNTVAINKTLKLTASFNQNPQPANKKLTWSSSAPGIVSVNTNGVVKGVSNGQAKITACSVEKKSVCSSLTIKAYPTVTKLTILDRDNGLRTIDIGTRGYSYQKLTYKLAGSITPYGASQSVTWKSSNTSVATVSQSGVVTGLKPGTATITVTANAGSKKSASVKITVKSTVQPGGLNIQISGRKTLKRSKGRYVYTFTQYTLKPNFTQTTAPANKGVVWKSSNTNVYKITQNGVLTPVLGHSGSTVVSACSKENKSICGYYTFKITWSKYAAPLNESENLNSDADMLFAMEEFAAGSYEGLVDNVPDIDLEISEEEVMESVETDTSDPANDENAQTNEMFFEKDKEIDEFSDAETSHVFGEDDTSSFYNRAHFVSEEQYILVGDSLVLDYENPNGESLMVGLSGDTDAVLWDEELNTLSSIGEAEVTAFLAAVDTIEVKDLMVIHVVSELPDKPESETDHDVIGLDENEVGDETVAGADSDENDEPAETPEAEESVDTPDVSKSFESEDNADSSETEQPSDQKAAVPDEEPVSAEEPFSETISDNETENVAEDPIEVMIRDLDEYEDLIGEADGIVTIERERFELDNETLGSLVFEIENEFVAKLTERSVEEMLVNGIEIRLLTEGETKLVIKQEGKEKALREIRLIVTAAPLEENQALPVDDEVSKEKISELQAVSEPAGEQALEEYGEENIVDFFISVPETEQVADEITAEVVGTEEE